MYLKKLELVGFKSFPEKIALEFKKGITCVVGPNGSGKSNISDAVRWVLGEQNARALRGGKMEDIIFAGTQNRKPLGFGQVSIVIDNQDKKIPIEFSEITICRRAYRSGESEFLINNTPCRLKDIHELLMDTGVGREGYSIIGQGRIDEILNAKAEGKRYFFEEAAGIAKFRARREESLSRLEKERQNLARVEDILSELEANLGPLKKQAEDAKKYLGLIDAQKFIRVNIFLLEADRSKEELASLTEKAGYISGQLENMLAEKQRLANSVLGYKQKVNELDEQYKSSQNTLIEYNRELMGSQNNIKLIEEKSSFLNIEINRLNQEIEKSKAAALKLTNEISGVNANIAELKENLDNENAALMQKQSEFKALDLRMSEKEAEIDAYNTDILEAYKNISDLKSNINKIKNNYDSLLNRESEIVNESSGNSLKIAGTQAEISKVKEDILNAQAIYAATGKETGDLTIKRDDYLKSLEQKTNEYILLTGNLNGKLSRYKIIKELEEDFEGYFNSTKAILKQKKSGPFKGIHGALGGLIEVPPEYETAILIALGQNIQNIVTDTEGDAKNAIEYLKRTKMGRATFLPLSSIKARQNKPLQLNEEGIIGLASSLISYNRKYENIISYTLGSVYICKNLKAAISLGKKYNNTLKIVTLEGDLLSPGGPMTGGSITQKASNIFSRAREIKVLEKDISNLKLLQESAKKECGIIGSELESIKSALKGKKSFFYECEKNINNLNHMLDIKSSALETYIEKKEGLDLETAQLSEQLFELRQELGQKENGLFAQEENINSIKSKLSEFQSKASFDKGYRERNIKELTGIQINISTLTEKIKSQEALLLQFEENLKQLGNGADSNLDNIKSLESQIIINKSSVNTIISEISSLSAKIDAIKNEVNSLDNKKQEIIAQTGVIESDIIKNNESINAIEKEKTRLELKKEQVSENRRYLFDSIWENYNMTYQQALKFPKSEDNINTLYKKEGSIKNEVKQMGPVNVAAIDDYKELSDRYQFLKSQRDDIAYAEENLKTLISELTEMMGERFMSQFEIISNNFCTVFSEMFGGGKAFLKLMDPGNILESGIEITAQPPGKRLQSMSLLSGGERALTAIALLFAILKMKPSPFCILDEIEAALDDSNVSRFADYIKKFSNGTQFIVITHRKGTMESADVLYGVTMQEQGVSKLVSVELKNYEAV
ncbi:MAG: chromosome segregation protein SMC [Clostridiales bacterium]|jgi:chromosome segregation protein|nr:chromosome segregation protein SMC [Clostridiales bacterium]